MSPKRHSTMQVLRDPNVRRYVSSRLSSSLAQSLLKATIAWHLWKTTGSYGYLGILGLIEFLPVIPVSLYAGAFADTRDRRSIVLSTQTATLLGTMLLGFGAYSAALEVELILGAAFALAIASSFENPAGSSILPALVPPALFPTATVVEANARNLGRMTGPVLMGLITQLASITTSYAAAGVCFALAIAALARVRRIRLRSERSRAVTWASIREGVGFVRSRPAILGSMTLDMFAVIFAGATALLPVFADEILEVGAGGYGLLRAAMQVGTFAMAALLLLLPPIDRPGRALLIAVGFFGLATIVFAVSRTFALSLLALALAGMADQVSMVSRSIILQLSTPDALRGRVNSVNMIFIGASNELGEAESGFLAALTSATISVVAGGILCLGVLGLVWAFVPALRGYRIGEET